MAIRSSGFRQLATSLDPSVWSGRPTHRGPIRRGGSVRERRLFGDSHKSSSRQSKRSCSRTRPACWRRDWPSSRVHAIPGLGIPGRKGRGSGNIENRRWVGPQPVVASDGGQVRHVGIGPLKPNTAMLLRIRSWEIDLGSGTTPSWMCPRRTTRAGVRPYFSGSATTVGSASSPWPRPIGLTAGGTSLSASKRLICSGAKFETPGEPAR